MRLHGTLSECGASTEDRELLISLSKSLDELFLVTIIGEFNAGKSTVINALLGEDFCKVGVTPTTSTINSEHLILILKFMYILNFCVN